MITVNISGQHVNKVGDKQIVRSSNQNGEAEVLLGTEWQELDEVFLTWYNPAYGSAIALAYNKEAMRQIVPWEVLSKSGSLSLTAQGVLNDRIFITTVKMISPWSVINRADPGLNPEPTPTVANQVLLTYAQYERDFYTIRSSLSSAANSATAAENSATAAANSATEAATSATEAAKSKNAAANSATRAKLSEQTAYLSEETAKRYSSEAGGSAAYAYREANDAANSATAAANSATAAANSATAAANSATAAANSATASEQARDKSQYYAEGGNEAGSGFGFQVMYPGAKGYAEEAATSATEAATSAQKAFSSEYTASVNATTAQACASAAGTSMSVASDKAASAANSAASASASEQRVAAIAATIPDSVQSQIGLTVKGGKLCMTYYKEE